MDAAAQADSKAGRSRRSSAGLSLQSLIQSADLRHLEILFDRPALFAPEDN